MKRILLPIIVALFLIFLYSYKLLEVPTGLTLDEASFGYNAVLLANSAHDQNGRFLPMFVLTSDGKDWRQPVTQYYLAVLFRIVGPSVYLLRFSSVLLAAVSVISLYFLARLFLNKVGSLAAAFVLASSPQLMIQAHMGLDNIMPLPLTIFWLYSFFRFEKNKKLRWLFLSALSLGVSFYSYKGMRAMVPIWMLLTFLYLFIYEKGKTKISHLMLFAFTCLPFLLLIPLIERFYAGAILGGSSPSFHNVYDFFLPYLSSFDLSNLFITGDIVQIHSTGYHGVLLLASLPLIALGIFQAIKAKDRFWKFVILALLLGPLLLGLVGSVHRFSRLMALLPLYALLAGLGSEVLTQSRRFFILSIVLFILLMFNFSNFISYYWYRYPPLTFSYLNSLQDYQDVARLSKIAREKNLQPFVHKQVAEGGGESLKFFEAIYFGRLLSIVPDDSPSEKGTVLLTNRQNIPTMTEVKNGRVGYYVQIGNE